MLLREETTMKRRPGITLIEVLVAIFVMSIGLLALLTLFPLGALRMSQALQDDRSDRACCQRQHLRRFRYPHRSTV